MILEALSSQHSSFFIWVTPWILGWTQVCFLDDPQAVWLLYFLCRELLCLTYDPVFCIFSFITASSPPALRPPPSMAGGQRLIDHLVELLMKWILWKAVSVWDWKASTEALSRRHEDISCCWDHALRHWLVCHFSPWCHHRQRSSGFSWNSFKLLFVNSTDLCVCSACMNRYNEE